MKQLRKGATDGSQILRNRSTANNMSLSYDVGRKISMTQKQKFSPDIIRGRPWSLYAAYSGMGSGYQILSMIE
jgi:hypothetical protein